MVAAAAAGVQHRVVFEQMHTVIARLLRRWVLHDEYCNLTVLAGVHTYMHAHHAAGKVAERAQQPQTQQAL